MKALFVATMVCLFGLAGCNAKPLKEVNILQECFDAQTIWKDGDYYVTATPDFGCVWYTDKAGNNLLINVDTTVRSGILTTTDPKHSTDQYYTALTVSANAVKSVLVIDDSVE